MDEGGSKPFVVAFYEEGSGLLQAGNDLTRDKRVLLAAGFIIISL